MNRFVSLLIFLFCLGHLSTVIAQENIEGLVFDKETKQRIGRVLISNVTSNQRVFNNSRGEFSIPLKQGDTLVVSKENYYGDTICYKGERVLVLNLKKLIRYIDPVTVIARKTPAEILSERRRDYDKAFKLADPGSYISVGDNGAGLSIGAVYNYFSREGRNARRLTAYFQKEYEDNVIDLRFSKELVSSILGLEGEALDNFLVRYRPTYEFILSASHYQLVSYIKSKYEMFKFVPYIKPLPDLNKLNILPKKD